MSAVASFYRVPKADLASAEGAVHQVLARAEDLGEDYDWSGYVMMNLFIALEESGTSLGAGVADEVEPDEETGLVFFATGTDLVTIEELDLNQLDHETLGMDLDLDDEELREALAESVTFLHQLVATLEPDEVLVVRVG